MKKLAVSSLVSLFILSCSVQVQDNSTLLSGRVQYAPTGPLQDTSSASLLTAHSSPVKEDFSALAKKYNFAELETEYKSFKTKALSDAYVIRMFNKFLIVSPNALQVIRQIEFSRYLSNKGDTTYEASLESMFVNKPALYNALTTLPDVQSKITQESGTFGFYILEISPYDTVPVALTPDDITISSFTAKWTSITGVTSYKLILDTTEITVTGTSYPVSGLANGSLHTYSVKPVINGMTGTESNQITVKTILPAPVAGTATSIGQTSLTANWSEVPGATSYTLVFNGTEITGITGTSYTKNSLTPGISYPYFVKAVNVNTESVNSGTINTVTVPAEPTANDASGITLTSFTANWSTVTGATSYTLILDGTEIPDITGTSYQVTGLNPATSRSYYVKAKNASGISSASGTMSVTTLSEPLFMILVQGNTFTMGDQYGDGGANEIPLHDVSVSNFYMGKYEITQKEYQTIIGSNPAIGSGIGDNYPVNNVSWNDAIKYCNALSVSVGLPLAYNELTGELLTSSGTVTTDVTQVKGYRLPTEAEWEYAAKGGNLPSNCESTNPGKRCKFSGSNTLADVGWYGDISGGSTHIVGTKIGNELGIYDMSGNLWELTTDYDSIYSSGNLINPYVSTGTYHLTRGGTYGSAPATPRNSYRGYNFPASQYVGFRIVRSIS